MTIVAVHTSKPKTAVFRAPNLSIITPQKMLEQEYEIMNIKEIKPIFAFLSGPVRPRSLKNPGSVWITEIPTLSI
ncbi:Uncharacterised protein [Chlamydia trachomatis]|nr:Uncharacterised protein [Chlamydia trachomatis]